MGRGYRTYTKTLNQKTYKGKILRVRPFEVLKADCRKNLIALTSLV